MASSISNPREINNATILIILMDCPISDMMKRPPRKETGNPMATQKAKRNLKNSHITMNTSTSPCRPLDTSIFRRARTTLELSLVNAILTSGGASCFSCSTKAFTASKTRRVSSVLFLLTCSRAARCPLNRIFSSSSSKLSLMVAISPRRISPPLALAPIITSCFKSSVVRR